MDSVGQELLVLSEAEGRLRHGAQQGRFSTVEDSHNDTKLWDDASEGFEAMVADGSDWRQPSVILPAVMALLGDVCGQDVLDAGCGPGFLTTELARRRARVTAFDASPKMVALTRRRIGADSVHATVREADLCRKLPFSGDAFDAVVCSMVLMDVPEIGTALGEFRRVLRPSGRLVVSITHPAFFPQLWQKDADGKPLRKEPVEDYLTVRSETINMCGGPTRHYHRPLSYYTRELRSAGFVVDEFVEPVPTFPRTPEREYAWRVPDFAVMRALPR
jgi:ubiquinone/menaquinone biosynthesis C-methylase UbiE